MAIIKTIALPATLLFLLVTTLVLFLPNGLTEDAIRQMIRVTAASSMVLFCLAFSASSLNYLLSSGLAQPLMRARRQLGLSFALSHAGHLLAIIGLVEVAFEGNYAELGDIVGGSLIYLFIFAMAITSNNASVQRLGAKNWTRLHKTGGYLIWLGLFSSYLGAALETGGMHYWLYFALGMAVLLLRVWAFWDKRQAA